VSYENRLHFSTYRNKVSSFFEDITQEIGKDKTKEREITLNKKRPEKGRLIDIDWEKEINLNYIEKENVDEIISRLPSEVGVAFIKNGDEKKGLDVRHEGFIFDKKKLVHASGIAEKVVEVDFLDYLKDSGYDGVIFFKIIYN
ncbi:MAG: N-acetylmuramoyl-L-alanine amidase-like domain-containing protein, partial [Minisyncoccales bacterium]